MAKPAIPPMWSFLGLNVQGDLGPFTMYRYKRTGVVIYPRSPPTVPASPAQALQRSYWVGAAKTWGNKSAATKAKWSRLAKINGLRCTGYNVYVWAHQLNIMPTLRGYAEKAGYTINELCN